MNQDESETMEQADPPLIVLPKTLRSPQVKMMPLPEEAEWVQQASQGNQDAFVKLCENYARPIYRYFYEKVRSIPAATTLTSKTFHRAQESIGDDKWDGPCFGRWLFLIAHGVFDQWLRANLPDNALRLSAKLEEATSEYLSTPGLFPLQETEGTLWQLVKELSLAQQSLLILRHAYHLSYAEIAKHLDRSENACKQLHYRALKNLQHKADALGLWS